MKQERIMATMHGGPDDSIVINIPVPELGLIAHLLEAFSRSWPVAVVRGSLSEPQGVEIAVPQT